MKEALSKLKDGKAAGEDRIPYEFFKYAPETFHRKMAEIFTNILNTSSVDDIFRKSLIFPVHKKGDRNVVNNYRGITFMNCAAKCLMSILSTRLSSWVAENEKLNEFQSGFRAKYSTIDSIYNLSCVIQLKLCKKQKVYAFFVDFRAAFDSIPRKSLIYKLSCMGVSTKFLKLISELYKETESAVWDGQKISEYFQTRSGVKQGCLMSPLLFTLYLNDMHDALEHGINIEG